MLCFKLVVGCVLGILGTMQFVNLDRNMSKLMLAYTHPNFVSAADLQPTPTILDNTVVSLPTLIATITAIIMFLRWIAADREGVEKRINELHSTTLSTANSVTQLNEAMKDLTKTLNTHTEEITKIIRGEYKIDNKDHH